MLVVGFESTDKGIESFGIVLGHIKFNTGCIKGKDPGKSRVDLLTDGLRIVDHPVEHHFNMVGKAQLETCKKGRIRDLGKPTEIPEFFAEMQQKNKQGIRRDGEDFLEDESGKETGKGIIPFAAETLVKGVVKGGRDKQGKYQSDVPEVEKRKGHHP